MDPLSDTDGSPKVIPAATNGDDAETTTSHDEERTIAASKEASVTPYRSFLFAGLKGALGMRQLKSRMFRDGSSGIKIRGMLLIKGRKAFPFFKLPTEIRYMIYDLLLAPFYEFDEKEKRSYVSTSIKPEISPPVYSMGVYPYKTRKNGQTDIDWILMDWIRKLSQTSRALNEELGAVFWSRKSELTFDGFETFLLLQDLLADRPEAIHGIRSITVRCSRDGWLKDERDCNKFVQLCKHLAKNVVLEHLHLMLHPRPGTYVDLENLQSIYSSKFFHALASVKDIPLATAESFHMSLRNRRISDEASRELRARLHAQAN